MNAIGLSGESHGLFWARRNLVAAVVAAIFVFIAMLAMASPARAANLVVTSNADSGAGTLREAVTTANANTEADTITFDLPADSRTITLDSQIGFGRTTYNTTVDGTGQGVTVSGNNATRVFRVVGGNLTVKRLTVSDGNRTTAVAGCCDTEGGGIYNASGTLTVTQSTISGNTAGDGAGIYSDTNLDGTQSTTIENSTISGNTATFRGGGISNYDGRTNIKSSTITNNYAPSLYQSYGGGAGVASSDDTATETVVANSIISDNSSNCTDGTTTCAYADHGDVDIYPGSATNSFTSQGYNLIGDSSRVYDNYYHAPRAFTAFNNTGDQTGITDPKLGPLQDNGGPTQTHALLTDSKAIDKGSTTLATDQRGVSRPQGAADDVGAFELEIAVNVAPSFTKGADQTVDEDASAQTVPGWATAISPGPSNESAQTVSFTATNNNTALFSDQPQVSSDGTLTYTPAPDANGTATVTVTAKDSGGTANGGVDTSAPQTFTITVNPVNDAPVANNDTYNTNEDNALTVNSPGVLGNDTDVDSPSLTAAKIAGPSHGTVTLNANGSFTYTPNADYNGSDSFTYKANDGTADSNTATVNITVNPVNDAPVAHDDTATTPEDTPVTLLASDLLANDSTGPANESGQTLSITAVSNFQHGSAVLNSNGSVTFTPATDYNGSASFDYTVCDNGGTANGGQNCYQGTAIVNILVSAVNDAPSFTAGTDQTANEDAGAQSVANWASAISAGPADEAGQALNFIVTNDNNSLFSVQPQVASNGTLTYTSAPNANGSATVTVKLHDDGGTANGGADTSAPQTFTITVNPVNDAPSFNIPANAPAVDEDSGAQSFTGFATNISAGPANESGQTVSFPNVTNDNNSLFTSGGQPAIASNGTLTYTPAPDANGSATVRVQAKDSGGTANGGQDTSATATFTITVTPVNDPPTVTLASGGSCSTSTTSVNGTMNLSLADVDSSLGNLTLSATSSKTALVPNANIKFGGSGANRTVSITPAAKKSGSATITFTASDMTAKSTTTIQVIVGTDLKDTIGGTSGADMIFGLNGDDTINAGEGNDLVCGGNAGGVISGGAGDDTLDGGNGNDVLRGDAGKDIVRGSAGNDTLTGGSEADSFDGGSGTDVATDYNAAEGDTTTNIP